MTELSRLSPRVRAAIAMRCSLLCVGPDSFAHTVVSAELDTDNEHVIAAWSKTAMAWFEVAQAKNPERVQKIVEECLGLPH